jgi:ER lumen protein retaining receptor
LILGLVFNYRFSFSEILWSFSIWLEAIAILPQLFMLQRTGEAETITTHYLAALGIYRALYIPNWIYRQVPLVANETKCLSGATYLNFTCL